MMLYYTVQSDDPKGLTSLTTCLSDVNICMNNNFLKLNEDKMEVWLLDPNTN